MKCEKCMQSDSIQSKEREKAFKCENILLNNATTDN